MKDTIKRRTILKATLATGVAITAVKAGLLAPSSVLADSNITTKKIKESDLRLAILGTGFAALDAVKQTRKNFPDAQITVISPQDHLVYLPSLIWIPSGLKTGDDITRNLNNFFNRQNVNFIQASVESITNGGRTIITDKGSFDNDGLIIGTGGRFLNKLPGLEHAIIPCKGVAVAEQIKQRLAEMTGGTIAIGFSGNPKEKAAVRGGPMFEFLFGIDTQLRREKRRDKFKLVFYNPSKTKRPAARLGPDAPEALLGMMAEKGIETHLGHKILKFEKNKIITKGGEIPVDLNLFMPGRTGPAWLANSELPKSKGGLIVANKFCQVEGLKATYVAGDSGSFPGPKWQAKQAHSAGLQAVASANNLWQELQGNNEFEAFPHRILCIVDTLSHGIFTKRTETDTIMWRPMRTMHFAKRAFETKYLFAFR